MLLNCLLTIHFSWVYLSSEVTLLLATAKQLVLGWLSTILHSLEDILTAPKQVVLLLLSISTPVASSDGAYLRDRWTWKWCPQIRGGSDVASNQGRCDLLYSLLDDRAVVQHQGCSARFGLPCVNDWATLSTQRWCHRWWPCHEESAPRYSVHRLETCAPLRMSSCRDSLSYIKERHTL